MALDYEIIAFESQKAFRDWLEVNHATVDGIWLKMYKKASGIASINYAQALDEALCYGWIDGQSKSFDDEAFLQKFTPRRKASMWSKRNIEHVARLTAAGKMTQPGQSEIDRAKADGRWDAAYDAPSQMTVPDYFIAELAKHPTAELYFASLNKTNTYAIVWNLHTAKTEATRLRRMNKIIAMLENGEKFR